MAGSLSWEAPGLFTGPKLLVEKYYNNICSTTNFYPKRNLLHIQQCDNSPVVHAENGILLVSGISSKRWQNMCSSFVMNMPCYPNPTKKKGKKSEQVFMVYDSFLGTYVLSDSIWATFT